MKDRIVDKEYYIGRLYHPETGHERWLKAEVIGENYRDGVFYDKRRWSGSRYSNLAHRFPVEEYSASKARAIFKVTKIAKQHVKRGYQVQVILVRAVRELIQVGENANPLIQLAMLAEDV